MLTWLNLTIFGKLIIPMMIDNRELAKRWLFFCGRKTGVLLPIISSPGEEEQQTEHTQCGKSHNNQLLFVQVRQISRTILSPIRGNFLLLVVHREQRNRQAIRTYTEGGGVAIADVHFTRENGGSVKRWFPIREHGTSTGQGSVKRLLRNVKYRV